MTNLVGQKIRADFVAGETEFGRDAAKDIDVAHVATKLKLVLVQRHNKLKKHCSQRRVKGGYAIIWKQRN